jgi:CRISPR/Cas system CSM-associated protein Csm5 (group 7 of RAMP superfamily)
MKPSIGDIRYALTWNALEDHKEEANEAKNRRAKDDELDKQDLPSIDCYAEIEYTERDFKPNANKNIEDLVQVAVLRMYQQTNRYDQVSSYKECSSRFVTA